MSTFTPALLTGTALARLLTDPFAAINAKLAALGIRPGGGGGSVSVQAETLSVNSIQQATVNQPLLLSGAYSNGPPSSIAYLTPGGAQSISFTTPGNFTWNSSSAAPIPPAGTTVLLESWGAGSAADLSNGGSGGSYEYKNYIIKAADVTSGMTGSVGAGGAAGTYHEGNGAPVGGDSSWSSGATVVCKAQGGQTATSGGTNPGGNVANNIGDGGFSGGSGSLNSGGGGAGSPVGAGQDGNGQNSPTFTGNGGSSQNGAVAGGAGTGQNSGAGGAGISSANGGSGGGESWAGTGGAGGNPGGGAGLGGASSASGGNGQCRATWQTSTNWIALTNQQIGNGQNGTWQGTGPTYTATASNVVLTLRDNGNPSVQTTTNPFNVVSGITGGSMGPLTVAANHRYMQTPAGQSVFLYGSHIWIDFNQQVRGRISGFTTTLTPQEYLNWFTATERGNMIRSWVSWETGYGLDGTIPDSSIPVTRSNTGTAADGGHLWTLPLSSGAGIGWNDAWWSGVQAAAAAAEAAGVYLQIIMMPGATDDATVVYLSGNNASGCTGTNSTLNRDTNASGTVWPYIQALCRKWADTMQARQNVTWEIGNELIGDTSTLAWCEAVAAYIKNYERSSGYLQHPVMLGAPQTSGDGWGGGLSQLNATSIDYISPGWGQTYINNLATNRPCTVVDGGSVKPSIIDTDHTLGPVGGDNFAVYLTRGWGGGLWMEELVGTTLEQYIDSANEQGPYGNGTDVGQGTGGPASAATIADKQQVRRAFLAINAALAALPAGLNSMVPNDGAASTQFCLTDNATQYLVYTGYTPPASFTVNLPTGNNWNFSWVDVDTGAIVSTGTVAS